MEVKRTVEEIDGVLNKAVEAMDEGTKWPGMSYEEGVRAGIDWILGNIDDNPMAD